MNKPEFSQTFPFVITNSFASKQDIADVDQKNPLDALNFVNAVEIIPDPAFQLKGMLMVTVNDLPVFVSPQVGFFNSYLRFSIPVTARQLNRQGHVKIFAWNGTGDGSPISASGTIIISDKNVDASSGSVASNNPRGSDSKVIFPYTLRAIGVYTQNIDLAGYKKLLLLIASAAYVKPVNITRTGAIVNVSGNAIDGDLTTKTTWNFNVSGGTGSYIVDWGNSAIRNIAIKSNQTPGNVGTVTNIQYAYSNDGVNYFPYVLGTNQNMRYFRYTATDGNSPQVYSEDLYEVYDSLVFGGQAQISFEALEPSSNQWIEIVSAASIGTISQGQAVSKQLGDTMALTNLNVIFASNYAGLRMKLTIINGNIQTAVSVQRLA